MTPEEEARAKAEHEKDPTACVWPYPEHDKVTTYDSPDFWQGECRRCGAEFAVEK